MKNMIKNALSGNNSNATAIVATCVLVIVVLGCGLGKSGKSVPSEYVGAWTGSDGSTITIRGDSSGDYKSGGTTVTGGAVSIDEAANTLNITFVGIGPKLKIDKVPSGNQMTLDGVVYKKSGGSSDSKPDSSSKNGDKPSGDDPFKSGDSSKTGDSGDVPANSVVEGLVKSSVADLADAVDSGDFSDLYANASPDFRSSYSLEKVSEVFKVYVTSKSKYLPILKKVSSADAKFSPPVSIRSEKGASILVANGEFDTGSVTVSFENEYVKRGGEWKMLSLVIKMK